MPGVALTKNFSSKTPFLRFLEPFLWNVLLKKSLFERFFPQNLSLNWRYQYIPLHTLLQYLYAPSCQFSSLQLKQGAHNEPSKLNKKHNHQQKFSSSSIGTVPSHLLSPRSAPCIHIYAVLSASSDQSEPNIWSQPCSGTSVSLSQRRQIYIQGIEYNTLTQWLPYNWQYRNRPGYQA